MYSNFKESVVWPSFNVFSRRLNSERYDVLLFILTLHRYDVVNVADNVHFQIENILDVLSNPTSEDQIFSNVDFELLRKLFYLYQDDLNAIGAVNVRYILTNMQIASSQFTIDHGVLFEDLFVDISSHAGGSMNYNNIPINIAELMLSLSNLKEDSQIFNPFAGCASFGVNLTEKQGYVGQEINRRTWAIGIMRLLAQDRPVSNFRCEDVFNSNLFESQRFDAVLSSPPFSFKLNRADFSSDLAKDAEEFTLLHGWESLHEEGTLVALVSNKCLSNPRNTIRNMLIEKGAIAAVIHLPGSILNGTSLQSSIIIVNKKFSKEILLIDASKEKVMVNNKNLLSEEGISKILLAYCDQVSIPGFSKFVSTDDIQANDYKLVYKQYDLNYHQLEPNKVLTPLSKVLTVATSSRDISEQVGKVIRIKDLSANEFYPTIERSQLRSEELLTKSLHKITANVLLVSKRFNALKPSFVHASIDHPVYVSSDILAFGIDTKLVDPNYLAYQLCSDLVSEQLEANSFGALMPSISSNNFLKILIQLPTKFDQQIDFFKIAKNQSDRDSIKQANLQDTIDTLVEERTNELQWQLHDLRNSELLSIKNSSSILCKVISRYPEVGNILIDSQKNINLDGFVHRLASDIQSLNEKIAAIFEEADHFAIKENLDILAFAKDFVEQQDFVSNSVIIIEDVSVVNPTIQFNKKDLYHIFSNIFENINRHAFSGFDKNFQHVKLLFTEVDSKPILSVLNSGHYMPITQANYFANGGRQGKSGNSGKGGYIIQERMRRNGGCVEIEAYQPAFDGDSVFNINLFF